MFGFLLVSKLDEDCGLMLMDCCMGSGFGVGGGDVGVLFGSQNFDYNQVMIVVMQVVVNFQFQLQKVCCGFDVENVFSVVYICSFDVLLVCGMYL